MSPQTLADCERILVALHAHGKPVSAWSLRRLAGGGWMPNRFARAIVELDRLGLVAITDAPHWRPSERPRIWSRHIRFAPVIGEPKTTKTARLTPTRAQDGRLGEAIDE